MVINYWAILVSAVASMVVGSVWYGPLFGKLWMSLSGMSADKMGAAKKKGMTQSYVLMFVGSLITAYVLSHFITYANAFAPSSSAINGGMQAAFWAWLGFIAPVTLGTVLWEGKSWNLWILNNGHMLLSLLITGAILGGWR